MAHLLFSPLKLRELVLKNRIVVSPMCQYSAIDGIANDWHLVHIGSRAVGGAALVICEATGVSEEGCISPADLGIWNDLQVEAFQRITNFIKAQNCIPGIQIAHAGRKAAHHAPWKNHQGPKSAPPTWMPLAPSALPFDHQSLIPKEMTGADLTLVRKQFTRAAENSLRAGFEILEIHMAHGYLLNEFLSPLTNHRTDDYGGSLENRMRFPLEIAADIRKIWPSEWPVFVRISAIDWVENGWQLSDSIEFCRHLKNLGIDLIDCSSGGVIPDAKIKVEPGYQVPFSQNIRSAVHIATGAVGLIAEAHQAENILQQEQADLIFIAREFLRDPYWPLHAAKTLKDDVPWPKPYQRAKT